MKFTEIAYRIAAAKKKRRNKYALPKSHKLVNDGKNHFPVNDEAHARNALSRMMQYERAPKWFDGKLTQLRNIIIKQVKARHKGIDVEATPRKIS
jgi:hypothetical protein